MKKNVNVWQRLLAFALVCVMVLSYMPVYAAAEEGFDPFAGFTVTLKCTTTATKKEITPPESGEGGEGGEGEEGEGEPGEPEYQYVITGSTYEVSAPDGADASIDEAGNAEITYQGKKLVASITAPTEVSQETTETTKDVSWSFSVSDWSVKSGDTIAAPAYSFGEGSSFARDSVLVWTITSGEEVVTGQPATVAMGTLTAKATVNGTEITKTTTVGYADATYTIDKAPGWYTSMPEVKVEAATSAAETEIAPVMVNGSRVAWTAKEDATGFTAIIPGGAEETSKTISVGDQSVTLNVDGVTPEIHTIAAYENGEGGTKVSFFYDVGASGGTITVTVGDKTEEYAATAGGGLCDHTIEGGTGNGVSVTIVSGTGLSTTGTGTVTAYPKVVVADGIAVKTGDETVLKNGGKLTFATEDLSLDVAKWTVQYDDGEVEDYSTDNVKSIDVVIGEGVSKIRVAVTDVHTRTFSKTVDNMVFDTEVPTIAWDGGADQDEKQYSNEEKTYTVTFADNYGLSEGSYAGFYINNEMKQVNMGSDHTASYTVKDGEHLETVVAYGYDKAGNSATATYKPNMEVDTTAPVIKGALSINAEGSRLMSLNTTAKYLKYDGAGAVSATLTLSQEEANPSEEDWSETYSVTVAQGELGTLSFSGVSLTDKAGNTASAPIVIAFVDATGTEQTMSFGPTDGAYSGSITFNAGAVDNDEPTGNLTLSTESTFVVLDGNKIYQDLTIDMAVTGNDGANVVAAVVDDWAAQTSYTFSNSAAVEINALEGTEVKNRDLIASINGNQESFSYGIDNLAPRVTVTSSAAMPELNADGTYYFQEPVTLTFALTDMLSADATVTYVIDGGAEQTLTLNDDAKSGEITVAEGTKLTALSVSAKDALGNSTAAFTEYTFTPIEVDGTDPVAEIAVAGTEGGKDGKVTYYDSDVTITAKVTEKNLATAVLNYTINGTAITTKMEQFDHTDGTDVYTYVVTLNEGEYVEGINLDVTDKSGRTGNAKNDPVVKDTTKPVITVEKNAAKFERETTDKAYYSEEVVYTVTVKDNFLNPDAFTVTADGADVAELVKTNGAAAWDGDTYETTITVDDDEEMKSFQIVAKDYAGHGFADKVAPYYVVDGDGVADYVGKIIVADTVNPVITAAITSSGEDVRMTGFLDADGKYFVYLTPEETHGTGLTTGNTKVAVNLTFTLTEKNPDATQLTGNGWTEASGVWTWSKSIEVAENKTANILVEDLTAVDMANRVPDTDVNIAIEDANNGEDDVLKNALTLTPAEGKYNVDIHVDRRTPENSGNTGEAPVVTITADKAQAFDNTFAGSSVTYALNVEDTDAGLDTKVTASVTGTGHHGKGDATVSATALTDGKGTVTVSIPAGDETNNIGLTLVLKDKVGNAYTYVETLGLDDHTPEVTVEFDNNSAQNGKYFKADRTATVTILDLNMAPAADSVKIKTNACSNKCEQGADTIKLTYVYNQDGTYNFNVDSVTDKVGHVVNNGGVKYVEGKCVAYADFVVDKTNPIIKVTYNPGTASGRDGAIKHYNQNLTATATITERNFRAADVKTTMPAGYAMTFTDGSGSDYHTANTTFKEGNNYAFSISYTDLAGNPAQTYSSDTFCVDPDAPTIEISRGNLTNKGMNIVQDDLTLGFTINDEEKNLSEYKVTVTRLDNEFKTTELSGSDFYSISEQEKRTTIVVNFANIAQEKLNDGLYTVKITAKDFAGNTVSLTPDMVFSLNRFGSTFMTDDQYTLKFLEVGADGNAYHDEITNKLVIHEINPNKVWNDSSKKAEGSTLTVIVNGTSTVLTEGKDYKMSVKKQGSGDSTWYIYTYEINPEAFKENEALVDGRYSILIYGEDEAGNKNTNETNVSGKLQKDNEGEYNGKIEFILDSTAPIITTTGIESGKNYNAEAQKMEIFLSDNTPSSIVVYLNGNPVPLVELMDDMPVNTQWLVYNEDTNSYTLNVPEMNTLFAGQEIRIVVVDAAGNEAELYINDFSVSTNLFVRLLNSTAFIISAIAAIILLAVLLVLKLKKRKIYAA